MTATRLRITVLLAAALAFGSAAAQAQSDQPSIKIGITHNTVAGASYTLKETASGTELDNSDPLVGTMLFAEWVVLGRVGLELGATPLPLERSYELEDGGTTVSSVTEQAQLITVGANLYFNRRVDRGLQYLAGVGAGTLAVSQDFKNGTLGDQSSSVTIPLTWVRAGLDYVIEGGGGRLTYTQFFGSLRDTEEIDGYTQTYEYNLGAISLGVFVFF